MGYVLCRSEGDNIKNKTIQCHFSFYSMYLLWCKFILVLMFFELVSISFAIVPDYSKEYTTKENKN